ncbi:MAG: archaetidylserine decarboxylase [Steroidobacteraceae bacterium]
MADGGARLFVAWQHLVPQHALSRGVHRLARCRAAPVKNALIRAFVASYRPRLEEALEPDPLAYASFNDFFTRALRPDARPLAADSDAVLSPVDGAVSQIGELDELTLLQAKGRHYSLGALLSPAGAAWTRRLAGGAFATLYLAPFNYHRIHMPLAATLKAAWYVPGRLFSVNTATASAVTGLFARNERVICAFESDAGVPFAMVLVGALFVGSIETRWHGEVTPCRPRTARTLPVPREARLAPGAEMGRFNMGSTVILLFPRDALAWRATLGPGSEIAVGQPLAQLTGHASR